MDSTYRNETDDCLPKGVNVDLDSPFVDNRGEIQPIVDRSIQSIVIITSKRGRYEQIIIIKPIGIIVSFRVVLLNTITGHMETTVLVKYWFSKKATCFSRHQW